MDVSKSYTTGFVAGGYRLTPTGSPCGRAGMTPIIFECNNHGAVTWMTELANYIDCSGTARYNFATKIERTNDGTGYLVQGAWAVDPITNLNGKIFISKVNTNGSNTIWTNSFSLSFSGLPDYDIVPTDFTELTDNRVILVGHNLYSGYLIELNSNGLHQNSYTYTVNGKQIQILGIELDANNEIWLLGNVVDDESIQFNHTILFKVSSTNFDQIGEVIYYPNIETPGLDYAFKSFNSNFLIGGDKTTLGFDDMILKTDAQGKGSNICHSIYNKIVKSSFLNDDTYDTNLPNTILPVHSDSIPVMDTSFISEKDACCDINITLTDNNVKCGDKDFHLFLQNSSLYTEIYWNTGETTPIIEITEGNTYTITVTNSSGCVGTASYTFDLPLYDDIEILGPEKKCCSLQEFSTSAPFVFGTYNWTIDPPASGTVVNPNLPTTEIIWNDLSNNSTVTLYVTNDNGCDATFTYLVKGCCPNPNPSSVISTEYCFPTTISSLGLTSPYTTTGNIYINHDLIIDQDFTFLNCPNIFIENDHKIIVEPGVQFKVDNSRITAKCNYMWDGIYVDDPNSLVSIWNNSRIEQAKNVIVSDNGGDFDVSNSFFINDYVGIKVNPYGSPHGGTVHSTSFNSTTGALLSPHNQTNTRMYKGIDLNQVNNITLGDMNFNQNHFNNADYGIYDNLSNMTVENSRFTNLELASAACTDCACPIGTGICAIGNKQNTISVDVLGTNSIPNIFNKVNHGVDAIGGVRLLVEWNEFDNAEVGVRYSNNVAADADILDNEIKKFKIGILCSNNTLAPLNIRRNVLNQGLSQIGFLVNNTGIYVFNTTQQDTRARIQNNEINKTRNGIFLRNTRGLASYPLTNLRVEDNTINFGAVPNGVPNNLYGIRLEETDNAYINNNIVEKQNNLNPNLNVVPKLRGISLLNSKGNTVTNNEIKKMGTGIRVFGACDNSTLACNILNKNFHGFLLEGPADIGDQLPGAISTGNDWTTLVSSGASDIDVDLVLTTPLTSWFRDLYPPILTNDPTTLLGGGTIFTTNSANCLQFNIQAPIDDRENKLGKIVRNEKSYNSYSDEFTLNDKKFAFRFLKENQGYLSLGTNDDSLYQNFYQNCTNNCIGKFENVIDYILVDSLNVAKNINNSIIANIQWENNLKVFNEIYIRYMDGDTITANDSILLEEIAFSNAIDGGYGVISARAFLNLDIEDTPTGTLRSQFFEEESENEKSTAFIIFPNPTNDFVQINFEDENVICDLNIKDITGKIILQENNVFNNQTLNLTLLSEGIYLIELISNSQLLYSTKLVIIK